MTEHHTETKPAVPATATVTGPVMAERACAACGTRLEAIDGDPRIPYAGDIFTATGHYGSTMFDPVFGGEHLELTLCTGCLTCMRETGSVHRVLHATEASPERVFVFGSPEDTGENPWNDLRLANERIMDEYLLAAYDRTGGTMGQAEVHDVFEQCHRATVNGQTLVVVEPATDTARVTAAAHARIAQYAGPDAEPTIPVEADLAEARATLHGAQEWDAANGFTRISTAELDALRTAAAR